MPRGRAPQLGGLCRADGQLGMLPISKYRFKEANELGRRVAGCLNCAHCLVERQPPFWSSWGLPVARRSAHMHIAYIVHSPRPATSPLAVLQASTHHPGPALGGWRGVQPAHCGALGAYDL